MLLLGLAFLVFAGLMGVVNMNVILSAAIVGIVLIIVALLRGEHL